MKAPFAYYGGKAGLARRIAALLPAHRVYLEPFFGSGAVLFAKQPCMHEVINDLDGAVVNFFRVLRERRPELEEACALTPHARAEFDAADLDAEPLDDVEFARRFWVRVNQSFAKTAGRGTGWSVTTARTQSIPSSILTRLGRFGAIADRLAGVTIENCDACDLIDRLATPTDALVYVDAPYPFATRTGREYGYEDYRCEMGDEESHRRLAKTLQATPAAVVLSGYPCDLYAELFDGWWFVDFAQRVHSSNARTHDRGERVERLWCNRDLDDGRLFT